MALLDDMRCFSPIGPVLPDTPPARIAARAAVERLNTLILTGRSATNALETWCGVAGRPATIRAESIEAPAPPPHPEQHTRLQLGPGENIRYRRVRLTCGDHILSEAENWYVPARLDREMNHLLETTALPFGKAVAALDFTRVTFAARILWPEPPDFAPSDDVTGSDLAIPAIILEHRALLYDRNDRPFSEVNEFYTRATLNFGAAKIAAQ